MRFQNQHIYSIIWWKWLWFKPWLEFPPPPEWIHWNWRVKSKAQAIAIVQKRYSSRNAWWVHMVRKKELDKLRILQNHNTITQYSLCSRTHLRETKRIQKLQCWTCGQTIALSFGFWEELNPIYFVFVGYIWSEWESGCGTVVFSLQQVADTHHSEGSAPWICICHWS